ncbi:Hypothetical predicted protein [Mytilus galloprovincialis]|uniref:Uncharacterized protein n=1 Tax=Mytilus galloprovincialis TaxID=29158 RepID=A0A8B6FBP9_MYTGA|nr:Hypothetical predicted protein [Mytilus galloprovincialis]
MAIMMMIFKKLNIPVASHKTIGPVKCLEYLGIILDTEKMEARLPTNKVERIYASSTKGFGGYHKGEWFSSSWSGNLELPDEKKYSMAFLELYPIVVAAILWGSKWSKKRILFWCDNEATVAIVKKGRSKCLQIMSLMRQLTWCACKYNFHFSAKHVPGYENEISDALSRFQMDRFRRLAPNAALQPHQCPPSSEVMWS